jgi:hypothetical protein
MAISNKRARVSALATGCTTWFTASRLHDRDCCFVPIFHLSPQPATLAGFSSRLARQSEGRALTAGGPAISTTASGSWAALQPIRSEIDRFASSWFVCRAATRPATVRRADDWVREADGWNRTRDWGIKGSAGMHGAWLFMLVRQGRWHRMLAARAIYPWLFCSGSKVASPERRVRARWAEVGRPRSGRAAVAGVVSILRHGFKMEVLIRLVFQPTVEN